jgi:hypothetical protein
MNQYSTTDLANSFEQLIGLTKKDSVFREHLRTFAQALLALTEAHECVVEAPMSTSLFETGSKDSLITLADPAARSDAQGSENPSSVIAQPQSQLNRPTPDVAVVSVMEVADSDLPMIEQSLSMKAEGTRWAETRRRRIAEGADFYVEIEPLDRDITGRARRLPDCFLWMCHPSGPQPPDPSNWANVAGCFATAATGICLVRNLLAAESDGDAVRRAIEMLAEAQSALKIAIARIDGPADKDQLRVFNWLKSAASRRQFYISRFMRADDPADPMAWTELNERMRKLDADIQQARQIERQKQRIITRIRFHLNAISKNDHGTLSHDWEKVIGSIEELVANGTAPSNRELREVLLPMVEQIPDVGELPSGTKLVLREIDRFLAGRPPAVDKESSTKATAEVKELATLLDGKTVVLIGGDRRQYAVQALESQLGLKKLDWVATAEHESFLPFEAHIARPEVTVVLLAIRWSSHAFGEIKRFCDKHDKPLVRLPAGYNPNQVAIQVLNQCGDRLRAR